MGDVVVRRAGHGDVEGLVACSSALFAEDAGTRDPQIDIGWPGEHGPARFAEGVDDPGRLLLVADHLGEVVGHLAGALVEPSAMRPVRTATLVSMYVRPAFRGQAVGERLAGEFLRWASAAGAETAEVTAYSANAGAVRFYERQGFASRTVTLRTDLGPVAARP